MVAKAKDKFNNFLEGNYTLNSITELKLEIKKSKKGKILYLLSALMIGSFSTLLLSFFASVLGYGNPTVYLFLILVTNFISILINDVIFVCFLNIINNQRLTGDDFTKLFRKVGVLVLSAILLSICQGFISTIVLQLSSAIPTLNVILSIIISITFTLLNALVVFYAFGHKKKIGDILSSSFNILVNNWRSLFFISIFFLCWSYVSNVAFTNMLFSQIQQTQGINNIFHSLLQQHDYLNLLKVSGFYGMNYLAAGFLEIDILLGLAILYKKQK